MGLVWVPITSANSIHLAAAIQLIEQRPENQSHIVFSWMPRFYLYPSRMSRSLIGITTIRAKLTLTRLSRELESRYPVISSSVDNLRCLFKVFTVLSDSATTIRKIIRMDNIDSLRLLNSKDCKLGTALANLLASETRDESAMPKRNICMLAIAIFTYYLTLARTNVFLIRSAPSIVYVYNGRFLQETAIADAVKQFSSISLIYYETIRDRVISTTFGFHDLGRIQAEMVRFSKQFSDVEVLQIGKKYFRDLSGPKNDFYLKDIRPKNIESEYIVYFSSSDDEYVGFWDFREEYFGNQINAIRELSEILESFHIPLIVRLHPNLQSKPKSVQARWEKALAGMKVEVIGPADTVSSYKLLLNALGVVSYGSTIGMEAVVMGRTSLVLVDCMYDQLGCVTKAKSKGEIELWAKDVIEDRLRPSHNSVVGACIRGLWIERAGDRIGSATLEEFKWGAWHAISILGVRVPVSNRYTLRNLLNHSYRYLLGCKY